MIWVGIGLLLLCAMGFLLWPWLGRRSRAVGRRAHDLAVYKAQLDEVDADLQRGVLSVAEAEAARIEIKRRLLRADQADAGEPEMRPLNTGVVLATAVLLGLLPVAAVGIYATLGRPDVATASAATQRARAETQEIESLLLRLRQRLEVEPQRADGWLLLGRTLMNLNRYGEAAEAFERFARLQPDDGEAFAYLGEALVFGNDGTMVPAARTAFRRALELDPEHPSARYYMAEAKLQDGDPRGAFNDWKALLQDAPADAAWTQVVRQRLQELAPGLGERVDLPALPAAPPTAAPTAVVPATPGPSREQMEAAQSMSQEDRDAMVRSMVERLAERLKGQPDDVDGWIRLARAREVLKDLPQAREAYARALALLPASDVRRSEIEGRLRQLGP